MPKVDPSDNTANVGVRWPARCIERVDQIAAVKGSSRSAVLRQAVSEWLDEQEPPKPQDVVTMKELLDRFGCTPRLDARG